ncbi:MAG: sulfite exporter TauE/SafE family protein [Candidatus Dadabacteria bacterium]
MSTELAVAGLIVGVLIGATGIGGGVIMAPILLFLGIEPSVVVGSDLFYGFITKIVGTAQHYRQGSVNIRWVKTLGTGSVFGALSGIFLIHQLFNHYGIDFTNLFIRRALGAVLVFTSVFMVTGETLSQELKGRLGRLQIDDPQKSQAVVSTFGAIIGFVVGITSIGSGSVIALFLLLFSGMKPKDVVGTDIAHAVLLTGVAALGHMGIHTVDFRLVSNMLIGSLPGVMIGSYITALVPSKPLKLIIALLIIISGLRSLG